MPFLKKNNLKHADYATKSVQELIPSEALKKATVKQFDYSPSCVAINKGKGQFVIEKLPPMTQLSSINAIYCMDINDDGKVDVVSGGNQFDFIPQLERLDASMLSIRIPELLYHLLLTSHFVPSVKSLNEFSWINCLLLL